MNLPVSRDLMLAELRGTIAVLEKWEKLLALDGASKDGAIGIPVVDYPAPNEHLVQCMTQMQGELVICAGKCENLAEAIHDWVR